MAEEKKKEGELSQEGLDELLRIKAEGEKEKPEIEEEVVDLEKELGLRPDGTEVEAGSVEALQLIAERLKKEMRAKEASEIVQIPAPASETVVFAVDKKLDEKGTTQKSDKTVIISTAEGFKEVEVDKLTERKGADGSVVHVEKAGVWEAAEAGRSALEEEIAKQLRPKIKELSGEEQTEVINLFSYNRPEGIVNIAGYFETKDENEGRIAVVGNDGKIELLGVGKDLVFIGHIKEELLDYTPIAIEINALNLLRRKVRGGIENHLKEQGINRPEFRGDKAKYEEQLKQYYSLLRNEIDMDVLGFLETDYKGNEFEKYKERSRQKIIKIREGIRKRMRARFRALPKQEIEELKEKGRRGELKIEDGIVGLSNTLIYELREEARRKFRERKKREVEESLTDLEAEEILQYFLMEYTRKTYHLNKKDKLLSSDRTAIKLNVKAPARTHDQRNEARERAINMVLRDEVGLVRPIICAGKTKGGRWYKITEFIESEDFMKYSLEDILRRIAIPSIRTLERIAELRIIHRDIKPTNILIKDGYARLLDLGIARIFEKPSDATLQFGKSMGTPQYITLEQIAGGEMNFRTDMALLAKTLYVYLTGERPFPYADQPTEIIDGIRSGKRLFALTNKRHKNLFFRDLQYKSIFSRLFDWELRKKRKQRMQFIKDLQGVLGYAHEPLMGDRYDSLQKFREDLESILNGRRPEHFYNRLSELGIDYRTYIRDTYETGDKQVPEYVREFEETTGKKLNRRLIAAIAGFGLPGIAAYEGWQLLTKYIERGIDYFDKNKKKPAEPEKGEMEDFYSQKTNVELLKEGDAKK